ncbi:hypothetical protein FRX31_006371, partial [Thalictrum thalictroides]
LIAYVDSISLLNKGAAMQGRRKFVREKTRLAKYDSCVRRRTGRLNPKQGS